MQWRRWLRSYTKSVSNNVRVKQESLHSQLLSFPLYATSYLLCNWETPEMLLFTFREVCVHVCTVCIKVDQVCKQLLCSLAVNRSLPSWRQESIIFFSSVLLHLNRFSTPRCAVRETTRSFFVFVREQRYCSLNNRRVRLRCPMTIDDWQDTWDKCLSAATCTV